MTWQLVIILQILVSTFMTLFTRQLSMTVKHVFFGIGMSSYAGIALAGFFYSLLNTHGLPAVPPSSVWIYLIIEGLAIPAAWLILYKTISYIGAANAIVVSTLNTVSAALMGILLLNEGLTLYFVAGAILVIMSTLVSLKIPADTQHTSPASLRLLLSLVIGGALLFGVGMYSEKVALDTIGVWNYSTFGWGTQFVGAFILFIIFGRKEINHFTGNILGQGLLLGLITSVAGGLYIYALSIGNLSNTIIATSGKVALTVLLAAVFLRERNSLHIRIAAFALCVAGLWLIVG